MANFNEILKQSNQYYSLICLSYIRQIGKNKWRVYSRKGKNMGTFSSKQKAKERLRQIEYFKRVKSAAKESTESIIDLSHVDELSYSCVVRELRKVCAEDIVVDFLQCFKGVFDVLLLASDTDIHENSMKYAMALFSTKHIVKLPMKKEAQIFSSNPQKVGQYLAHIVKFLLRRVPEKNRSKAVSKLKGKFKSLDVNALSSKNIPAYSSMGQAITFVKNVLFNNGPGYIEKVINSLILSL